MTYDEAERELRTLLTAEAPLLEAWQADTLEHEPFVQRLPEAGGDEAGTNVIPLPRAIRDQALELAMQLPKKDAGRLLGWFYLHLAGLADPDDDGAAGEG